MELTLSIRDIDQHIEVGFVEASETFDQMSTSCTLAWGHLVGEA